MDIQTIKETDIWALYEKGVSHCRMMGVFDDTDINYRMYNGDQWYGLKTKGVEKIQYNFIKPIVKYKTGTVLANQYAINFSSENFENAAFRKEAEKICKLLNKKAAKVWEKDHMDMKLRLIVKDAAINDEGVLYVDYDEERQMPVNQILDKTDIFYGDENNSDIQSQPYILMKKRMSVAEAQREAESAGVNSTEIQHIIGDLDNIEEAGEDAKLEVDNKVTVITKLYKDGGRVYKTRGTKYVMFQEDVNTGLTLYPVDHLLWEEKKGSARGEGEVRMLIPNQVETNRTAMRRALTVKNTAYPIKVVNEEKIVNPDVVGQVGCIIKAKGGNTVEDVHKIFASIPPAQMSSDVKALQEELIASTRELAGAGEIATGQVNPESASGRAILAVQQAAQQPLTEHLTYTKMFLENIAMIWLEMLIAYNDHIDLEEEVEDPVTGEKYVQVKQVLKDTLIALQAAVKIDITPKGAFDKYAREQSLENLLTAGFFQPQRIPELKRMVNSLEDDSVMPKQPVLDMIEDFEKEQRKIAQINAQAQMMMQRANSFLMGDPDMQAAQMLDAERQLGQGVAVPL